MATSSADARADRIYRHHAPRLAQPNGRARAQAAWDYARARINDLPEHQRADAYARLADHLVAAVDTLTVGEVRTDTKFVRTRPVANPLRAQARRVRARG